MSYIAPNSDIYLLANIPLDKTYDHTIRWNSQQAQYTYFTTRGSTNTYHLTGYSYQRVNSNTLKVEFSTGNIYKYNYLMFKNTSFENKWFYAFIDRVDYINNNVYQITYELDVMQTWYFDYSVDEVFIERENVKDDTVGANLVEENLDIGDYVWGKGKFFPVIHEQNPGVVPCVFVIMCTTNKNGEPVTGGKLYNSTVYSGLNYIYCATIEYLNEALENIINAGAVDGVIGIYQIPTEYTKQLQPEVPGHHASFSGSFIYSGITGAEVSDSGEGDILGYTPVNKKLLCYPYNCLMVSNNTGVTNTYRYEFFGLVQPQNKRLIIFDWYANALGGCTVVYTPRYKNAGGANANDFSNAIKINATQMCSWVNDFWKAYKAQHLNRFGVEAISSALDVALSVGSPFSATTTSSQSTGKEPVQTRTQTANTASSIGGVVGSAINYASLMAKVSDYKRLPPTAHLGSDVDTLYINQQLGITFRQQCITREYAERIDRYFSKFGYRVKAIKKPAVFTNQRCTHWNFINTIGCTLTGSVPNDDLNIIASIYDKGITFWDDPAHIGEYSYYGWDCGRS